MPFRGGRTSTSSWTWSGCRTGSLPLALGRSKVGISIDVVLVLELEKSNLEIGSLPSKGGRITHALVTGNCDSHKTCAWEPMRGAVKMSHKGIGEDQDVNKSEQPVFSVVRLVGWTYGIQDVSKAKKDAVQAFQALTDDGDLSSLRNLLVIWDGDQYAPNSFTEILGHLASILPPSVRFVSHYFSTEAPCSQYEHDRMTGFNFESIGSINFSEALPPIENLARCTLVPIPQLPDQTYLDLALAALQWVQGSAKARTLRVLCFGGGQTVRDEMQRVRSGILPELEITYVKMLNGQSRINRQGELEAAPVEPVE